MQIPAQATRAGGNPRILVAEDHVDSREALCELLAAFGYEVFEAINGRHAVERAVELKPDLILMDVMMPEMDGFDAIRTLRARNDTRLIPIIAVTAMDGAKELAMSAGANDYVRKPVDMRRLIGLVTNWAKQPAA